MVHSANKTCKVKSPAGSLWHDASAPANSTGASTRTVARFEEDHYPDEAEAKIKANVTANVKEKER